MSDPVFDLKLLPPELKLTVRKLALKVGTGETVLSFKLKDVKTAITYEYGSALTLGFNFQQFNGKLGFNPSDKSFKLGASYGQFRFGANAGIEKKSFGLSLDFGTPLLPFVFDLEAPILKGERGLEDSIRHLPYVFDQGPMRWYKNNKAGIGDVIGAVSVLEKLAKEKEGTKIKLGGGATLKYDAGAGVYIMFKFGIRFK